MHLIVDIEDTLAYGGCFFIGIENNAPFCMGDAYLFVWRTLSLWNRECLFVGIEGTHWYRGCLFVGIKDTHCYRGRLFVGIEDTHCHRGCLFVGIEVTKFLL